MGRGVAGLQGAHTWGSACDCGPARAGVCGRGYGSCRTAATSLPRVRGAGSTQAAWLRRTASTAGGTGCKGGAAAEPGLGWWEPLPYGMPHCGRTAAADHPLLPLTSVHAPWRAVTTQFHAPHAHSSQLQQQQQQPECTKRGQLTRPTPKLSAAFWLGCIKPMGGQSQVLSGTSATAAAALEAATRSWSCLGRRSHSWQALRAKRCRSTSGITTAGLHSSKRLTILNLALRSS